MTAKRIFSWLLAAGLSCLSLVSCKPADDDTPTTEENTPAETLPPAE